MSKLYQHNDNLILEIPLAGHDPKNIEITADNDQLTVKSSKKPVSEDWKLIRDNEFRSFFNYESPEYSSTWNITGIDCDKITSTWDNGLLLITLPPKEKDKHRIKVKI